MFRYRLISAILGIPVLIAAVWYGGVFLLILTAALILLGAREISFIFSKIDFKVPIFLVIPGCFILLAVTYQYKDGYCGASVVAILSFYLLAMVMFYPRYTPMDAAMTFMSTMYVGLIVYLFLLSTLDNARIWLILMLICTWANDTMAFLIGRKWGSRRLAPNLSPGKTVEGAVGGVLGSVIAAFLVTVFYSELSLWFILLLGMLVGLVAQIGDLVESALKRQAGIKDAGNLIPGHGGILDRFDSMLFTAPLVYYYVSLIKIN